MGQGVSVIAGCPFPALNVETTGLPRFLGNPGVNVPCSLTPTGPDGSGQYSPTSAAFRSRDSVGSRHNNSFEAQSHSPFTRCLRFAGGITPGPRKTRFRLLANFAGRD